MEGPKIQWMFNSCGECLSCSSVYSRILKKQDLVPVKECLSSRVDELTSKNGGKQAKRQKIPSAVPFCVCYHEKVLPRLGDSSNTSNDPDLGWVFPLSFKISIFKIRIKIDKKNCHGSPSCSGFSYFQV